MPAATFTGIPIFVLLKKYPDLACLLLLKKRKGEREAEGESKNQKRLIQVYKSVLLYKAA